MNETEQNRATPPSGYLGAEAVTVETTFDEVTEVHTSAYFTVWRARRYGRWWALKGLNDEYADSALHRRMLRKEFEVLMRMQHAGVVQAYGMETVGECGACIVMEWVDGVTLDRWLEGEPESAARVDVLDKLLDAVAYVHRTGVVHRDLKPANVMVTGGGSGVKLIDFSLADGGAYAMLKQAGGTAGYIAPEQLEGGAPDVRNDVYSLGRIIEEMRLGGAYGGIVKRCMAPQAGRYATVDELRRAVAAAGKHQWLRTALLAVAVALLAGGAWLLSPGEGGHEVAAHRTETVDTLIEPAVEPVVGQTVERQIDPTADQPDKSRTPTAERADGGQAARGKAIADCVALMDSIAKQFCFETKLREITDTPTGDRLNDIGRAVNLLSEAAKQLQVSNAQYLEGLKGKLSDADYAQVSAALQAHYSEIVGGWDTAVTAAINHFSAIE